MPHEISFFHDWDLAKLQASGQLTQDDLYQFIRFNDLASDFRVFAIPKTVLTKGSADAMVTWLPTLNDVRSHSNFRPTRA